ncbi:MAG: substrate-binding domain-containing protein, partial [Duncaniella sp.]|nr:substrate-binding domain-containing protein [Duncaniella sp.]
MKIPFIRILPFLLLLLFAGCRDDRVIRIGVSQCSDDDWRRKMNEEIRREILLHPEARIEIRSADDSSAKQIEDLKYFVDENFDVIIVAPNEADALTPVVREIYESGQPVIIFDRNIHGNTYTARMGVDNEEIGRAAARYARHLLPENMKAIEIKGLPGSTPAIERRRGFDEELANLGNGRVVASGFGNWNHDDASRMADSLLREYPDANLIFAHNDRMAIAAAEVAKSLGLSPYIIGVDAAPEIGLQAVADSLINATFLYPTEGHRLVRMALNIATGKPQEKEVMLPLSSAVDHTNADILLLQNEELIEETMKIRELKSMVDDYWNRHSAQTTLFYFSIAILVLLFAVLFLLLRAFWQNRRHHDALREQNRLLEEQRDLQKSLNEQLSEATQAKLVFYTNVSHDLRTPLTLISGPVEQLSKADNLSPDQHTLLHIAEKNVKILRRLINQLLDFRRYENGKMDLNLSEVRFAALLAEWTETFKALAIERDIRLSIRINADDDATLAIDTEKIERVFFNLLSNAFKYTPDNGRITVSYETFPDHVSFSVADTGRGISEEDLGNIFERFFIVDKVRPKGSGIGLSLTKAFIELHGGTIAVESKLGEGTTMTVNLPVRHVDVAPAHVEKLLSAEEVAVELGPIESHPEEMDESKPLLLVIDDNQDMRKMLDELMKEDYNMIFASSGLEGIAMAARYVPDLIVWDVRMPGIDGLETCRRIKEEISTSHIPVLMLTACSREEERVEGYESGADGYVSKPFNIEVLRARCRNLIANHQL